MIAPPSLVQLMLVIPAQTRGETGAELIPAAFAALRKLVAVEPRRPRDRDALMGVHPLPRITLNHPDFLPASGYPASSISLASGAIRKIAADFVMLGLSLGKDGEQLDHGWRAGLAFAPLLASELGAGLAFMNGGAIDDERSVFPPDRSIGELPGTFTPWIFLGERMLSEDRRARLKALSACQSKPLGAGWQVQAVRKLTDEPSPAFLTELEHIGDDPITYLGPRI